ncbi:hypothetical protein GOP47_0029596 [Adiantum capillus-veneris]|nr:hypothetical protein GOP47_0029596 [Adiantum capillus-veneris]
MKTSLKFREEKNPFLRAKIPFKVGALPLSSGVAVGNSQELAVHLGTFFSSGPAIKVAFKPNDATPLSVVLKAGLGPWGSPHGAPITVKAELFVSPKGGDPVFTLSFKPRVGDFGLQKDVNGLKFVHAQHHDTQTALVPLQSNDVSEKLTVSTPPLTNGEGKAFPRRISGNFTDKDRARSPSLDSVVIGSNFSLKIEGLDREWKGKNDKKQKAEGAKEHESEDDMTPNGNGNLAHVRTDVLNEPEKFGGSRGSWSAVSLAEVQSRVQGCKLTTHSILPVGKQARLNIRWGVKAPRDIFQRWDGSLPSISLLKLPSLLLDKISFEQVSPPVEKPKALALQSSYFEGGFLPASFVEENRELAQVASLCFSMKRQLHLLYAENQVLRKSMEDMRSQVEFRGLRSSSNSANDSTFSKEQVFTRPSMHVEAPWVSHNGREDNARKSHRDTSRRDMNEDVKGVSSLGRSADMSKELEKAIKSVKNGSSASNRDS